MCVDDWDSEAEVSESVFDIDLDEDASAQEIHEFFDGTFVKEELSRDGTLLSHSPPVSHDCDHLDLSDSAHLDLSDSAHLDLLDGDHLDLSDRDQLDLSQHAAPLDSPAGLEPSITVRNWDAYLKDKNDESVAASIATISAGANVNDAEWNSKVLPLIKAYEEWIRIQKATAGVSPRPFGSDTRLAPVTEDDSHGPTFNSSHHRPDLNSKPSGTGGSSRGACVAIADNSLSCTSMIRVRKNNTLSPLGEKEDIWEMIEVTIDSGACDTVLPTGMLASISLEETEMSREGAEYEVANGATILNMGQKRCILMTQGSNVAKSITFQVCDVHKPLMSVSRLADVGYECVLGKDGGKLVDTVTGEVIPLQRRGNLYFMNAWVKAEPKSPATPFGGPR